MKYHYVGLGVLVILGGLLWLFHYSNQAQISEETAREEVVVATVAVIPLAADVSILSTLKQGQFDVIATTSSVANGSTVKTSVDGRAVVAHEDSIISSLDNNSEIVINLSSDKKQSRVAVVVGRMWSKVARAVEQDEVFEVYTPTMVAAVRGTSFGVSLNPRRSLIVAEGTVWVTRRNKDTGEQISSSTISVTAGSTVEDDGLSFFVRPTSAEDKDDWYQENNSTDNIINNPDTIKQFLLPETPPTSSTPATPTPNVAPTAVTPTISSVSPERFDPSLVDKVRISGKNFTSLEKVLLNGNPVEFLITSTGLLIVNTSEFRDGYDTYDLTVTSKAGSDTLKAAFEVVLEGIDLAITRAVYSYDQNQNSLVLVNGPGMSKVDTVLINNQSVQYEIINAEELRVLYPFLDITLSVEVRAQGQTAKGTVSP
jgi:hypothetical protein